MIEHIALGYLIAAMLTCLQLCIVLKDDIFEEFGFAAPYIILSSLFWPASLALHITFYFRSKRNC